MAAADTARLIASLELKDQFTPGLAKANRALSGFDARLSKTEGRAYRAGQQIGTGIKNAGKLAVVGVGILASQVALGLQSLIKLEQATAQTNAVIQSTGGAAGVTAEQVAALSEKFESLNATVGDEFIQAGQNMLLTFTNIRGKAFEPALQAVLDMNTAMGKGPEGLTSTAIQVGKALNDPTKGITALRKAGVAFTDDQVAKIKSLQKEGKLYEAQQIVLKELNKEFGGSFLAQGGTTAAKVAKFTDSIEDLQRSLAEALLPAIGNVADELSAFLQDPAVKTGVADLGKQIGELFSRENVATGISALKDVFAFAKAAAPVVATAAQTMGAVIGTAVSLFKSLPPEIQNLAVAGLAVNKLTGGLVTNIAGGLISSVLKQLVSGVVNVNGAVVNVTGAGLPGAAPTGGGTSLAGKVAIGATIIGGVALSAESISEMATQNAAAADRGLNAEEIAAQRYYTASAADQATIAKRIGRIPSREDWLSGLAKLNKPVPPPPGQPKPTGVPNRVANSRDFDTDKIGRSVDKTNNAIENLRREIGPDLASTPVKLDAVKTSTVEAGVAAKNAVQETKTAVQETKTAVNMAGILGALATTTVGLGTQSAVRGVAPPIVSALSNLPTPITTVTVNVSATHVTKSTTVQNRYGPGNGSSGQNARPGDSGV